MANTHEDQGRIPEPSRPTARLQYEQSVFTLEDGAAMATVASDLKVVVVMASLNSGAIGYSAQRSASTRMAVLLIWSLVGLLAIRTLLTIVFLDSLIDAFGEGRVDAALGRAYLEEAAPRYVPIALISLVLFGGLLALCAIFIGRGARWARITAIVMSVLALLGALLGIFVQASTVLFIVVNVLVAVTALGVIYYLIKPDTRTTG